MEIFLRSVEMDSDGESVNVRVEIYQRQTRQSIALVFKVKKESSLDLAVKTAERMLRNFGQDLYSATSAENPLLGSIVRQ
jgi:hypothetical protein